MDFQFSFRKLMDCPNSLGIKARNHQGRVINKTATIGGVKVQIIDYANLLDEIFG